MNKLVKSLGVTLLAATMVAGIAINPFSADADKYSSVTQNKLRDVSTATIETGEMLSEAYPEVTQDADISVDILEKQLSSSTPLVTFTTDRQITNYLRNSRNVSIMRRYSPFKFTSADNSKLKYFPKINNQGSVGSCTAWATVYYQYSYAVNKALNRDGKLVENTFSPTWVYNMINDGYDGGSYYSDALAVLSEIGAVPMTKIPAVTTDEGNNITNIHATKENWLEASKYKISEFYNIDLKNRDFDTLVTCNDDVDLDTIKKALVLGEVLSATTFSDNWCRKTIEANQWNKENDKYLGESIITRCDGETFGSHRITIVGFNDNIWVDINEDGCVNKGEKGAFKIANSWGESFDNNGFVWMSYDAINRVSSVPDSENVKLTSDMRDVALFDVIGFKVDVDETKRDVFLDLDIEAEDASEVAVQIEVRDKTTGELVNSYAPVPFAYSNTFNGLGYTNFEGYNGTSKGQFCIDLSNIVEGINKENYVNYDFEVTISDDGGFAGEGTTVKVNDVNIYIKSDNNTIDTAFMNPKTLNSTSLTVFIGSEPSMVEHECPYFPEAVG